MKKDVINWALPKIRRYKPNYTPLTRSSNQIDGSQPLQLTTNQPLQLTGSNPLQLTFNSERFYRD